MTLVVATGTFSVLHPGHITYLEEARTRGDRLIVIVARDEFVRKRKNSCPIPEQQRLAVVRALKPVDEAILGDTEDIFKPIEELKPDIIALGRDQDFKEEELEAELSRRGLKAKVIRVQGYWESELDSSKKIIARIREDASQG